jgi:hypothetical protein
MVSPIETSRFEMNIQQPASMVNYTKMGFAKTRLPPAAWEMLSKFWTIATKDGNTGITEYTEYPSSYVIRCVCALVIHAVDVVDNSFLLLFSYRTSLVLIIDRDTITRQMTRCIPFLVLRYHNTWDAPTTMWHLEEATRVTNEEILGHELTEAVWRGVREEAQKWTGNQLVVTSVYGIRSYHNGSILAPHVDRLPLVTSAIVNVAQKYGKDDDESSVEHWPLEVYDHTGKAHNISMVPGDLVLYESHSIIHGRPFPFRGDYFANVFVHFQPLGPLEYDENEELDMEKVADLPPYIIPGSVWEPTWREENPNGWEIIRDPVSIVVRHDLESLQYLVRRYYRKDPTEVTRLVGDGGWLALHEAVRQGRMEIITYLVEGEPKADVNAVVGIEIGDDKHKLLTPLGVAARLYGRDHEVTRYILARSNGNLGDKDISEATEEDLQDIQLNVAHWREKGDDAVEERRYFNPEANISEALDNEEEEEEL